MAADDVVAGQADGRLGAVGARVLGEADVACVGVFGEVS